MDKRRSTEMEKTIERDAVLKALPWALLAVAAAFATVAIVYGLDSMAPGVHDAFHDFRHVIGMPCH
jgi:cobalt transporter subunit CbtB